MILFILGGGKGVLGGLKCCQLEVWGPKMFLGLGRLVGEFVVPQGHALRVGVCVGGGIPCQIVLQGDLVGDFGVGRGLD